MRRVLAGCLAAVMLLTSSTGFARGPKGGGAAGALDDFDLLPPNQTAAGLPANLVNGFATVGSTPGDGTTGVGGIPLILPGQPSIVSQSGEAVTLLPGSVNGNSGRPAGIARLLGPDGLPAMRSLKSVGVPPVPELTKFIRDRQAAIVLGKALFWDVQAGSDGNACASCHFHAGADNRLKNQLSPGLAGGDQTFQPTATGGGGTNYKLKPEDFPFHRLAEPMDRNSNVLFDSNDVVSSQGAFGGVFKRLGPNGTEDCGERINAGTFDVKGTLTRRVPGRNSPTVINAVFNYRNFWDGRANNSFNGVNPFGPRDTNAKVLELLPDGSTNWTAIALTNASLASQAVGPALSEMEMSCASRTFKDLGRKLLALQPLRQQEVHPEDSVLGAYIDRTRRGLKDSYADMIRAAFDPRWWNAPGQFDGYTQMESNFSLFWGLAIMMYESTLVSDEAPFDKFVGDPGSPGNVSALTDQQRRGLVVFRGKGQCVSCHKGAEFTGAATTLQRGDGEGTVIESMFLKTGEIAVYDNGFYNIGVRPAVEDRGVGGADPFGNALSFTRNWFDLLRKRAVADPVWVDPCLFSIFFDATACWIAPEPNGTRVVVEGAFKTPTLRNIALTQPYFHNGSRFTLEQVVEFYNRGGDRRGPDDNDTTGLVAPDAPNSGTTNVHPAINPLGLTVDEQTDLAAFLRDALTDQRVACEQAPFDHPSLRLHDGHVGNENTVRDSNHDGKADDQFEHLPAVGANGRPKTQCLRNDNGSPVAGLPDTVNPAGPPSSGWSGRVANLNGRTSSAPFNGTNTPTSSATTPSATTPGTTTPSVTAPSVTAPGVTTPSVAIPSVTTQSVTAPSIMTPGATTPGATTPSVTTSGVATPSTTTPSVSASSFAGSIVGPTTVTAPVNGTGGNTETATSNAAVRNTDSQASNAGGRNSEPQASNVADRSAAAQTFTVDERNVVSQTGYAAERNAETQRSNTPAWVVINPTPAPPTPSISAPANVLAGTKVTMSGSISGGNAFSWTQTVGPRVKLSGANTLAPGFTAPAGPTKLIFALAVTNGGGASATATRTITVIPDDVRVVTRAHGQEKDKLEVVATSSAITANTPAPPEGMTMTATFWDDTLPAGRPGSVSKPMTAQMQLVRDMPGLPPVCASALPCFNAELPAVIVDPKSPPGNPAFVRPTTIVVSSSLGGLATAKDAPAFPDVIAGEFRITSARR
jgi:cytochrome c peroxidase